MWGAKPRFSGARRCKAADLQAAQEQLLAWTGKIHARARINCRLPHATTKHVTMPPAKRVKSSATQRKTPSASRAGNEEGEGESEFATIARQHWLKTTKRPAKVKVKNEVLKREIWDTLEKEDFPLKSLLALEGLQTLEGYVMGWSSPSSWRC